MFVVSTPPPGLAMSVRRQPDHVALSWPNPKGHARRYVLGPVLAVGLVISMKGLGEVAGELIREGFLAAKLDVLLSLIVAMASTGFAVGMLIWLFRPARDERLLLYGDRLVHHPGSVPIEIYRTELFRLRVPNQPFKPRPRIEIMRHLAS